MNALTNGAFCPQSKQPELKHAAVKLSKAELPYRVIARAWLDADQALTQRARGAAAAERRLPYAACVPFGREPDDKVGVWLHAASAEPLPDEVLDAHRIAARPVGRRRAALCRPARRPAARDRALRARRKTRRSAAFLLAGDVRAAGWIGELLVEQLPADLYGRALLSGSPVAPTPVPARGAQVCSAASTSPSRRSKPCSRAAMARPMSSSQQLQGELKCGTNCGSCLPKLRSMVRKQVELA